MAREPGYCLHKPSGRAYVNLGGKVFYLGDYGSEDSHEKYAKLKAEWRIGKNTPKFVSDPSGPTLAAVALEYLDHAEAYYGPGTELENLKLAIVPLSRLYGTLPAAKFGPLEFRAIRQWWLEKEGRKRKGDDAPGKLSRQYINSQMKRLMRVIKWAVGQGTVPPTVHQAIKCVDPLKRGRSSAPESEPVRPVELAAVEATCTKLTPIVADMVRLQLLLGCRPGEIVVLKPGDVHRHGEVWEIRLAVGKRFDAF